MRVVIVVTHLLGTGHLARALTLGRAFAAAGDEVTVISGGVPVPHFDIQGIAFVQLPPLRSDGVDFSNLLAEDGNRADVPYLAARQAALVDQTLAARPSVVLTELFPFGRRSLKGEFQSLLKALTTLPDPPLVLSSIRDILAPPSKPSKVAFADSLIEQMYDGVLVHSDPDVVPLQASWPVSNKLAAKLHYTGFVAPPSPQLCDARGDEVVVSAGGGTVGDAVFDAACAAAALVPDRIWHLLVGGASSRRERLATSAPPNVRIEPPRPDFRDLMCRAYASVSMCGYNTALDVLQTGVPAVVVPFDDGGEVEQDLRAKALEALQGITILRQAALSGPALAAAVSDLSEAAARPPRTTGMDGAARSVDIVHNLRKRRKDAD